MWWILYLTIGLVWGLRDLTSREKNPFKPVTSIICVVAWPLVLAVGLVFWVNEWLEQRMRK